MNTRSLDLDLDLPTDIPDLPPPWPPTDVAIEWWMNRAEWYPNPVPLDECLDRPSREHQSEPFVLG